MATIFEIQCYFVFFFFACLVHYFLFKKFSSSITSLRLPPSPPTLPIIGNLHHLSSNIHECFGKLSKYGPLISLRFGFYRCLLVSSGSLVTEIFKQNDVVFSNKPILKNSFPILFGNSSFFTAPYGDYWRFMKEICVSELFSTRQLDRSRSIRRAELTKFMQKILRKSQQGEMFNLQEEAAKLTNNMIIRMTINTRSSEECDESNKFAKLVMRAFQVSASNTLANMMGPFRLFWIWTFGRQTVKVVARLDEYMENVLEEHEEKLRLRENNVSETKNILDILLTVQQDPRAKFKITRNQIKAFLLDMLIGGTGTTAETIEWAMAELLSHPIIFNKVREEINSVVGTACRLVDETDIASLPLLQAVMKESLRLHPAAPMIPRQNSSDVNIGGFDIAARTPMAINAYVIMRDPNLWVNPNEFNPDRFMISSQNPDEKMNQNLNFLAFGGGRRVCPGKNLGLAVLSSTVAAMVQCFDWQVSGGKVNIEVGSGMTMKMAHPLMCFPQLHFNPFAS